MGAYLGNNPTRTWHMSPRGTILQVITMIVMVIGSQYDSSTMESLEARNIDHLECLTCAAHLGIGILGLRGLRV